MASSLNRQSGGCVAQYTYYENVELTWIPLSDRQTVSENGSNFGHWICLTRNKAGSVGASREQ